MAQLTIRGNLSISSFPFVSDWFGRSVIVPQYDENYIPPSTISGADADKDRGIPEMYYGHNLMPTEQGYKSVSYVPYARQHATITNFDSVFVARDPNENKCLVATTSSGKILMYATAQWIDITPIDLPTPWAGGENSVGYANGFTYLCLAGYGIYKVDVVNRQLTHPVWGGIVDSQIYALTGSVNYLIAATKTVVAWSSTTNPEDFTPSLITGSGSGTPNDLAGIIIAVTQLNNGFCTYSTKNIILASFSGNTRYPWVFRAANNGAGITSKEVVAFDGDQGTNYAWTGSGLLKVSTTGCVPEFPAATDFLAGKVFEDFDPSTNLFTIQYLQSQLLVKLKFTGSRFLIISYGINTYTHAIIYDTAFKRWGKLKITHVDITNLEMSVVPSVLTYAGLLGQTYASLVGTMYSQLTTLSQQAASPKYTMSFLQANGQIVVADTQFGDISAQAVAIFGKYQVSRSQAFCTLHQIDLQSILPGNLNFALSVLTSIDGSNIFLARVLSPTINNGTYRRYNTRQTGMNHSLVMSGAFNICSYVLTLARHGRR